MIFIYYGNVKHIEDSYEPQHILHIVKIKNEKNKGRISR